MISFSDLLFGRVKFRESEEHLEFQYKFLVALLWIGALATLCFLVAARLNVNPMDNPHLHVMTLFTGISIAFWLILRGRKHLFLPLAWAYEILCLLEFTSALIFVPTDELRIVWFFINIPGIYILLGKRSGAVLTVLIITGWLAINPHLSAPYSINAVTTGIVALLNLSLFFHVYGTRSISYFKRMRDYNQRLYQMATRDPLTGTLNARAYYEQCEQMIQLARRNNRPFAVLFVDLDHFKSVNDTYGHAAGDCVLKAVAEALLKCIRGSDALGRIGGEEFSIFLPDTPIQDALRLAETLRGSIERLRPSIGEQRLKITASIGAACGGGAQTMAEIQRQADQAMYVAKTGGRNRVSSFADLQLSPRLDLISSA